MSIHRSLFKGGLSLSVGQVVSQVCSFVRSVILARLISPENFGIAATFAMTFSLLEMLSNFSSDKLLVQSQQGNEPRMQQTAQFFHVIRGVANGGLIFLLAGPISGLFGVPQARWAFQCLALVPVIRAFIHLDTNRFQRDMRFGPSVLVDVISSVAITIAVVPLAWKLRDYSAMLWLLILQSIVFTVGSHLLAERPYRVCWDRNFARQMAKFGWPLLVNGLLMFGIFEGDRFVIGSANRIFPHSTYNLTDLGVYSVAFSVTMAPTMFVANVFTSLFLPLFSRAQGAVQQFQRRYLACSQLIALISVVISIPFVIAGGKLVSLVYGHKYGGAAVFIGWLAAMWALRMVRVTPTLAAISLGDTPNAMISNVLRSLALLGILVAAGVGAGVVWICISGFFGELLATVVSVYRLRHRFDLPYRLTFGPLLVPAICLLASGVISRNLGDSWGLAIGLSTLAVAVTCSLVLALSPMLREDLLALLRPSPGARVVAAS